MKVHAAVGAVLGQTAFDAIEVHRCSTQRAALTTSRQIARQAGTPGGQLAVPDSLASQPSKLVRTYVHGAPTGD